MFLVLPFNPVTLTQAHMQGFLIVVIVVHFGSVETASTMLITLTLRTVRAL